MKRMSASEFVRVQGIGQAVIRLKDLQRGSEKLKKVQDGAGFHTVFEEELRRQEEKDGKSEEADIKPKEIDAKAWANLAELASAAGSRGQHQTRGGQQGIREAAGTDKGVMGC